MAALTLLGCWGFSAEGSAQTRSAGGAAQRSTATQQGGALRPAGAAREIIVLRMQAIDGDDEVAAELTTRLSKAAAQVQGWKLRRVSVSLAQMAILHGCETVLGNPCLQRIAATLKSELLLVGTLQRSSKNDDLVLRLGLFDGRSGTLTRTLRRLLARPQQLGEVAALQPLMASWLRYLTGSSGALRLQSPHEGAEVRIDGQVVGELGALGLLEVLDMAPGQHELVVRLSGYAEHRESVAFVGGSTLQLRVVLQSEAEAAKVQHAANALPRWRLVTGWTAVATGAVFFGLSTWSFVHAYQLSNDPTLQAYRQRVPAGVGDICADPQLYPTAANPMPTDLASVKSTCSEINRHEDLLRWLFLGIGAAATATGLVLLLVGGGRDAPKSATNLTGVPGHVPTPDDTRVEVALLPSLGRTGGGLTAVLTW